MSLRFDSTPVAGAFVIDVEPHLDERGFFARTACIAEFESHGANAHFVQQSVSWNPRKGTLRGLHYQASPHQEEKLVRVTRGAIYDVIVDLRPSSPDFGRWFAVELTADNHRQLFIPKGVAHGFQTIQDDTEVLYEMTTPFHPDAPRGIRWNDPSLAITWPFPQLALQPGYVSPKDETWPTLQSIDRK